MSGGSYITAKPLAAPADVDSVLGISGNTVKRFSIADMRGLPGVAGPPGAAGTKWHFGAGVPAIAANEGDTYLNISTGDVYERRAGAWSYLATLKGPDGPVGPVGPSGDGGTYNVGSATTNVAPAFGAAWGTSGTTPPTVDANGAHFVGASNIAAATSPASPSLKDNTQYQVKYTVSGLTGGGVRVILSGASTAHGFTGTTRTANGTYTETGTTSGASTATNLIRIQATGASGTNTFTITNLEVTEVGGGVDRSMTAKVKEIEVSVTDFGADATGVADSTAAFNAAIASGAMRIHIPAGIYRVTSLVLDQPVILYGDGRHASEIQITGAGNIHGIRVIGNETIGSEGRIQLKDFKLTYVGAGQTVARSGPGMDNWSGIYIQRSCSITNVYVNGFTNDGIYFSCRDADEAAASGGTAGKAVFFALLDGVWSKNNGRDGIAIRRGANANTINNCQFDKNGRYGLHHYTDGIATYGNSIRDGQASYNKQEGYYFENGTNLTTSGMYAEYNGSPTNTNTDGYTNTTYDFFVGDSCVRSWIGIGTLLNANTARVRLPAFNSNQIQVWEGGRRLFGDT